MQRSSSFGTSWADQWDYGADPSPRGKDVNGDGKKQDGMEKTKAAAATGLRKVKEGTAHGFRWIKDKYQKKNTGDSKSNKQDGAR